MYYTVHNTPLTTGMDTLTGTGTETVAGLQNAGGVAGGQNYQSGDSITNVKNVNLMVTANDAGAAVVTLKDVTNVTANSFVANTLNAAAFTNVANIKATGGQGAASVLTINNGSIATTYAVEDVSGSGITVNARAGEVLGSADTIKFAANAAGSTTTGAVGTAPSVATAAFTSNTAGIETVSVATTGTNVFNVTAASTGTDGTKLVITGAGNNTIGTAGMTNVATYDMSGATGNNTLNVAGTLTTSDSVIGGTGADTLRMNNASTIANISVTGVETLRLSTGSSTGNTIFSTAPSFTTIRVDGDAAEAGTQTLTNLGASATTISYVGSSLTTDAGNQQQFNNLSIINSYGGSADSVSVKIANGGVTAAAGYGMNTLTASGIETMSIAVSDTAAGATTTFTGITDVGLSSLTVSSAGGVNLGAINATNAVTLGSISNIDLSAVTGAVVSTMNIANNSLGAVTVITGASGTGGTTVTLAAESATDQVIYNGGVGVDTINGALFTGTMVINTGAGADVINGGLGIDVITAGEGADTITAGLGVDTIILTENVAASDTIIMTTGGAIAADTVTGFGGGTAGADLIQVDLSDLNTIVTDMQLAGNTAGALAADATPTVTVVTAAYDLGTVATSDVIAVSHATAFTAATLATALATAGSVELQVNGAVDAGDAILVVWDDNVNTYVSYVTFANAVADNGKAVAGDLTVTNILTLSGVADASTAILTGNIDIIA